jgi:tetratricopeptide (TPR) repeat protein
MKKISLLVALLFVGASFFAQKSSITDAALKYKKYNLMGSMDENKKALSGAKADIDLAAVNTETASDPYMHRYRGIIYFGLMEIATMEAAMSGAQPDENVIKEYDAKIKESFNAVLNHAKGKEDKKAVLEFVNAKSQFVFDAGLSMFNARNYAEATQMFIGAYEISKYINVENEEAKGNVILSFRKSADTLMSLKKYDEANKLGEIVMAFTPNNIEVIISIININLQKNDLVATEKYLNVATSIDSTNKELFLVLGTSLMDMKQPEKAGDAFRKALKLDPNYSDVIYQYCTMLFNWSIELRNTASDMKINDPKAKELEKKATINLNANIQILEPYIKTNPTDTIAIEIAWRTFSFLSNDVKHFEFKDRWFFVRDSLVNNKLMLDSNNTSINFLKFKILSDWAKDFKLRAEDIEIDEVKAELIAKSNELNKRTSEMLNKYLEKNPKDKTALEIGWRTYSYLDQTDKSAELKKRWEAIK